MITRATLSTIEQGLPKYRSMLAGNSPFIPTSFESIATFTSGGNFSFTNIPNTYQHLQLRMHFTSTFIGGVVGLRFNNDTSNSYAYHKFVGTGTGTDIGGYTGDSYIGLLYSLGIIATQPQVFIIDIHDYASTAKTKTVRSFAGNDGNGTGNVYLESGLWINTSAINRIDSNFLQSSNTNVSIALYGIKGA